MALVAKPLVGHDAGQFAAAAFNIVGQVVAGLVGLWAAYVITN